MRFGWQHAAGRRGFVAVTAVFGLAAGAGVYAVPAGAYPAGAEPAEQPRQCPEALAVDELERGMTGTGHTVAQGREVEPFDVEVLGVLDDGIAPGRDMIVVDTASEPIAEAGGVWSGMSGSPVYVGDRFVGAVAFSLSSGPSTIAGLTPAEDMHELLELDTAAPDSGEQARAALSEPLAEDVERRAGPAAAASDLRRLPLPVGVSGLSEQRLDQLSDAAEAHDPPITLHGAASSLDTAEPGGTEPGELRAGENFAAALSYGDLGIAGVGTTTLTCEASALAFGHSFLLEGQTLQGANAADAITIVDDPAVPFKLATVAEPVGVIDQDRTAGLRAALGQAPPTFPVTSTMTAAETGAERTGRTDVVGGQRLPELGPLHTLANLDVVGDALGPGSATLSWTVRGETAEGQPVELTRTNRHASELDIAFDAIAEMQEQLSVLASNPFTAVEFTSLDVEAEVSQQLSRFDLARVEAAGADGEFTTGEITAAPGEDIQVRAVLSEFQGSSEEVVELAVTVPEDAAGFAALEVGNLAAGEPPPPAGVLPGAAPPAPEPEAGDVDELLAELAGAPRNDEVQAVLLSGEPDADAGTAEAGESGATDGSEAGADSAQVDRVVEGAETIGVAVSDPDGGAAD